ncbi:homeobox domain protein, partial [Ancylostoma ceylanicum]
LTQADVGRAISKNSIYSQTTISRFENRVLSLKNMCRMKIVLAKWLSEVDSSFNESSSAQRLYFEERRRRKSRTTLEDHAKHRLEQCFANTPSPCPATLLLLAEELRLDYEVVRVWFCNRRQKQRREDEEANVPFSEAVILHTHSTGSYGGRETIPSDTMVSSQDPYPKEQLSEISDIYPFQ